jgi:MraZ protein
VFRGINAVNIDAKGRLAIPSRYRQSINERYASKLVATIDTDSDCLLLYPLREWEHIEQKIQALPSFNPQARRIQRLLIGHACDLEMDKNGRVLLPGLLREYATLTKEIMLIGQGKKFELWDKAIWNEQRENWLSLDVDIEKLPEEMRSLSL